MRFTDAEILEAAKSAQFAKIKKNLLAHYVSGKVEIEKWDDFKHHLSRFLSGDIKIGMSSGHHLRRRLARIPGISSYRYEKSLKSPTWFWFDRSTCDEMAAKARQELIEEGYQERVVTNG